MILKCRMKGKVRLIFSGLSGRSFDCRNKQQNTSSTKNNLVYITAILYPLPCNVKSQVRPVEEMN